jgi:glycosyltransferase involved in cell wall biosynthesis
MSPAGVPEMLKRFKDAGTEFIPCPEPPRNYQIPRISTVAKIVNACRKHKIEIIHAQDTRSLSSSFLASALVGKNFVLTKAGGPVTEPPPPTQHKMVIYSQEQKEGIQKCYNVPKRDLMLIRARIDMDIYKPTNVKAAFIKKYNLPTSRKKIAMAMRLTRDKQQWHDTILQLGYQISQGDMAIDIIIAGEGPLMGKLAEQADQINKASKHGPIIHLIGPIYDMNELNQFYNYADVVVGNGRGIMEAMACQKPVVILGENGEGAVVDDNNIQEAAKYNFSGRHFRYNPVSSDMFSTTLQHMMTDDKELNRIADFSYAYIKNEMDAEVGARQLVDVYQKALNRKTLLLDYAAWHIKVFTDRTNSWVSRRLSWWPFR